MSKFNASMFDKIKDTLNKTKGGDGGSYSNILKFKAGTTTTLRLLPITEEGKDPLFHYFIHQFTSPKTGKFASALSLQTFGEADPIATYRWKLWKAWKEANPNADNKEYDGVIQQKEQWLINVLVLDDPSTPENNNTVKILRMGPQIKDIIDDVTEGERKDEFGWEIFDPTAGYDLKIVATKQGEFTTFKKSYFTSAKTRKLKEDEIETFYEGLHDLNQVNPVKTFDELKDLLEEHFSPEDAPEKEERKPLASVKKDKKESKKEELPDPDDEIPMFHGEDGISDKEVEDLLAGLD